MTAQRSVKQNGDTAQGGGVSDLALAYPIDRVALTGPAADEEHGWVERARLGDLEAFDAIMQRYEVRLQRFLLGMVHDVDLARDLCQDTFLAAYKGLPATHGELHLSAWLHTIALNRVRSHFRRKKLRFFVPMPEEDRYVDGAPDLQESVASSEAVQNALARIPRQYAEVLLLQTAAGLTCREIARAVGCTEGAAKVRLLRARRAFRAAYEEGR